MDSMYTYAINLAYNNIDTVVENKKQITLIRVEDAHHGNILEFAQLVN